MNTTYQAGQLTRYNHFYETKFKETKSGKILVSVDNLFGPYYYSNKPVKFWEIKRNIKDFTDEKLQEVFKIIKDNKLWYIFSQTPFTVGETSYMFRGETLMVWNYVSLTCRNLTFEDFKNLIDGELSRSADHYVELCNHFVNYFLTANRNLDRSKFGEITNIDEFYTFCKIFNVEIPYKRAYIENAFSVREWFDV